jgi:predicted lipoprotein with Yx(FWY)xxD motif
MSVTAGSRAILTAVATVIFVAGCASAGGASTAPAAAAATPGVSAAASPAGSTAAGQAVEVTVVTDATLGAYLAGVDGKSLYVLSTDSAGKSTCSGDCAANWPPFTLGSGGTVKAGTGVTATIATFTRDDGTTQVTINGKPLYYFSGDTAAGQTNGQGIGGKWYLASPAGTPVGAGGGSPVPVQTYSY